MIAPHGIEDKKASSFKHNYKDRQNLQYIIQLMELHIA